MTRTERRTALVSAVAAVLLISLLVFRTSSAAFSATTVNADNEWSTGSVALSNNGATAMFSATGLTPSTPALRRCITVTYSGTLSPADVKLYGTASGALAPHLNLTVEQGPSGAWADCSGWNAGASTTIYSGTLANFGTSHTTFGTGRGTWNPTPGQTQVYRFSVTVADNDGAQNASATASFTWEAQA